VKRVMTFDPIPTPVKKQIGIVDSTELWFGVICILCFFDYLIEYIHPNPLGGIHTGLFCLIALLAALKIHHLGSISEKLEKFDNENKKLNDNVGKLNDIKESYKQNNKELSEKVDQLHQETDELTLQLTKLRTSISELDDVRIAMEKFAQDNQKDCSSVLDSLKKSLSEQRTLLDEQQSVVNKTKHATREQEKIMLLQLQSQVQFMDQSSGMSKMEYDMFVSMLPSTFRKAYDIVRPSFESLDENKDGTIDVNEFQKLVDQLVESTPEGS